jgi:hypothetical protein
MHYPGGGLQTASRVLLFPVEEKHLTLVTAMTTINYDPGQNPVIIHCLYQVYRPGPFKRAAKGVIS